MEENVNPLTPELTEEIRRLIQETLDARAPAEPDPREEDLADRERRLAERELRAMALERLAERGLPRELSEALPYRDEESCLTALTAVERAFRAAVRQGVDERLRGQSPVDAGRRVDPDALSDADYYRTLKY